MAKECSFDVVSDLDMQEVDNAVNQCVKEIKQRVYQGTVAHVAQRAAEFLEGASDVALGLRSAAREFEARAMSNLGIEA